MKKEEEKDHNAGLAAVGNDTTVVPASQLAHDERDADVLEQRAARLLMGYSERFERDAEDFYQATGLLAPGRSVPAAMGGYSEDERRIAWEKWIAEQGDLFRWALLAGAAALRQRGAAPELLAALRQVEAEMRAGFGSSFGETREQVRRAIAKTESRS